MPLESDFDAHMVVEPFMVQSHAQLAHDALQNANLVAPPDTAKIAGMDTIQSIASDNEDDDSKDCNVSDTEDVNSEDGAFVTSNISDVEYLGENLAQHDMENETEDLLFDGTNNKKLNNKEEEEEAGGKGGSIFGRRDNLW